MHKHLVNPCNAACEGEGGANEMHVLKDVQLGGKGQLLLLDKGGAEKLVPDVAGGASENTVGMLACRGYLSAVENNSVRLAYRAGELGFLVIVNVKEANRNIQIVLLRPFVKLFKKGWLKEIVGVEEGGVFASCAYNSLVSGGGNSRVVFRNYPDTGVLCLVFLYDIQCMVGGAVVNADYLNFLEGLVNDAVQRGAQIIIGVVNRHYNRNLNFCVAHSASNLPRRCRCRGLSIFYIYCITIFPKSQ